MKKDAYYFPHDSNAKDDPKCIMLIEELGLEGYGIFWVLIETLRDQPEYKADLRIIPGLARRYNTSIEKVKSVISRYDLFTIHDDQFFFSDSLIKRMIPLNQKREKARLAANVRWGNAPALHPHSERNASKVKYSKVEQSKTEQSKEINKPAKTKFSQYVSMYNDEFQKLVDEHGEQAARKMVEILDNYKGSKGRKYKDDYRAIRAWVETKFYKDRNGKQISFTEAARNW